MKNPMDRYISQLMEEIDEALSGSIDLPWIENPIEFGEFPEIEEFEKMPEKPIASWLDKESKLFPPVDFLNVKQMKLVSQIMVKAFEKINVKVELPEKIDQADKYSLLLELWDEPVPFLSTGTYHVDFCSGDCDSCRIRKYCDDTTGYCPFCR
jgi:hypothetical protein